MDSSFTTSSCFFFAYNKSSSDDKELKISIFKISNKLAISTGVSLPFVDFCILVETSHALASFIMAPLEHWGIV